MRLTVLPALLIMLALAGCDLPVRQAAQSLPAAATPLADTYPPMPEGLTRARVTRVVDGDTVVVSLDGREERVRFIGINTPESVDPRRPVECFGKEASASAEAMLGGRTVLLEDDPTQGSRDSNGRLLRYVWLEDGRMANLEQIAQGFAAEFTFDTPYKYRAVFRDAQRAAREAGLGLWSPSTCDGAFAPRGATPAPTPAASPPPARGTRCPPAPSDPVAPEAPLRIIGLDKRDEVVRLLNASPNPIDLDGWLLCSMRGGESQRGLGGTLAPGQSLDLANPGAAIWSNSQQDDAALYDPAGQLVSYWVDR